MDVPIKKLFCNILRSVDFLIFIQSFNLICILNIFTWCRALSHQTAMPQRLYSVLKTCQRDVGSPQNKPKISNSQVIACTQRPHSVTVYSVHMTFPQRLYSVHSAQEVAAVSSRRAHGPHTSRIQRSHGDHSDYFLRFFFNFEQDFEYVF